MARTAPDQVRSEDMFSTALWGYSMDQVDAYVEDTSRRMRRLAAEIQRLSVAENQLGAARIEISKLTSELAEARPLASVGPRVQAILRMAEKEAESLRRTAFEVLRKAYEEARAIRQDAEDEAYAAKRDYQLALAHRRKQDNDEISAARVAAGRAAAAKPTSRAKPPTKLAPPPVHGLPSHPADPEANPSSQAADTVRPEPVISADERTARRDPAGASATAGFAKPVAGSAVPKPGPAKPNAGQPEPVEPTAKAESAEPAAEVPVSAEPGRKPGLAKADEPAPVKPASGAGFVRAVGKPALGVADAAEPVGLAEHRAAAAESVRAGGAESLAGGVAEPVVPVNGSALAGADGQRDKPTTGKADQREEAAVDEHLHNGSNKRRKRGRNQRVNGTAQPDANAPDNSKSYSARRN